MKDKKYIVYIHKCPNNKRYIGTTSRKSYNRFRGGSGYNYNKEFYEDIKKYGWKNIEHIIVAENIFQNEAYDLEQKLIKKYNTTNILYGYNKQNGGEKGKNTEEIKQKMREARLGKKLSAETKEKLRIQKIGNKNPMFGKKPTNARKVIQYNLDNKFIKIWQDIHQIELELKIQRSNIIKCCKGERKSAGGYKWRYFNE